MANSVQGDAATTAAMAAPAELPAPKERLRWSVAVPIILGLSAALWAGIWYGARAIIG
jgi:hypothetical protein